MNKKITATLCVLALTLTIGVSNIKALSAGESGPGSSSDPVVTKGYVDRLIQELPIHKKVAAQEEIIGLLNSQLNTIKNEMEGLETGTTGDNTYKVVEVNPGEKLIGGQGTEIILRAGEGKAIISSLGGLQDVTEGVDITTGLVPKYHLLITPRNDGRGVEVTKKATFMVRGGYTIQ